MSKAVDAAVAVLRVVKDIIQSYLSAPTDALYQPQELVELFNNLSSEKIRSLNVYFNNAFISYSTPLPIRPHYAKLYHARVVLILELKKLGLNIDTNAREETTESLFLNTLSSVLQKKSFDLNTMTNKQIDDLFVTLEKEFRGHFIRGINTLMTEARGPSPEIQDIFNNSSDVVGDEHECATTTPFALSRLDGRSSSTQTSHFFAPISSSIKPSSISIQTVYDSDLDTDVEEVLINNLK